MHNCKATREHITELLLGGANDRPDEVLTCEDCRAEFAAIKATLRLTSRLIEKTTPPPSYWTGYHARLRNKLTNAPATNVEKDRPSWLVRLLTASVRVPVPVGVALLLVFGGAVWFAPRAFEENPAAPAISVVQVPVQVPVIQEKVVTRVVYRRQKNQPALTLPVQRDDSSAFAKSETVNPISLIGFKPLDEVRMTVIKGGSPDEK
jgi:hypothetical protein